MKNRYNKFQKILNNLLFIKIIIAIIWLLPVEVFGQTFTEIFDSNPCGAPLCTTTNFTRTLGGVQFEFTFEGSGDGGDFAYETENGDGGSASVNLLSDGLNTGTTETVTIKRSDNGDFIFNSLYLNNTDAQLITVQGYHNDSTVGAPQTISTGSSNTLNFGGITVDEIRLTSTDFYNINLDSFSGEIPVSTSAPTASSFTASNGPYEGLIYIFDTSDFGYSDGDGDPLDHLVIETLPAAGTLYVDADNDDTYDSGEEVSVNAQISKAGLDAGNLQYFQNGTTDTSFQFEVNDGTDTSTGNYIATLNMTDVNDPPVLSNLDGDNITLPVGTPTRIDAGGDAALSNPDSDDYDGGLLAIRDLGNNNTADGDFSVDGTAVTAGGDGTIAAGESIHVSGVFVGTVHAINDGQGGNTLQIDFNTTNATSARVQSLVRNLQWGVPAGSGAQSFTLTLNDGDGTANGGADEISANFTMTLVTPPTVITTVASGVDATTSDVGGDVTDDGGSAVSERGIVWSTSSGPDINDNKVQIGSDTGLFDTTVELLPFGTDIFFRAYAINSEGTAYGNEESFTTSDEVSVNLEGTEGWRLLAPPASVPLSTFLDPIWTQGVTTGGDTDFGTPNVYTWSTTTDGNDPADWQEVTDLSSTTPEGGHGVLVSVYEDPDYDGPASAGFPQTLSVTGSEYASGISPTMNTNATGWTLLGNPFASAVTFLDLSPTNLTDIVYVWDPNDNTGDGGQSGQPSGSWKTWNGTVGDVAGGRIASFQGFLVQNSSTGSSVTFSQASKTSTTTTFLGKENQNTTPFVRLELQGNGMRNAAWMEFTPEGSSEQTTGDAWELQPLSEHYALLASRKADGSLVDIGRYPQAGELEIPLITEATQPGKYTIQITDFEAPGQTLFLSDLQTGESVRLEQNTQYEFSINQAAKVPADPATILRNGLKKQASETYRFVISSSTLENFGTETPQTFALQQNYPNPFNPTTAIRYQLPVTSQVRLEIFDMSGRQISTLVNGQKEAGSHTVNFDASNLSSGVYMYRLYTNGNVFTKKLTLIK